MNDYLDRVEAQLTELTERGAHRRLRARRPMLGPARSARPGGASRPPRRRAEALAFLAGLAVVAAVVAIVLVNVHGSTPHNNASSAARSATESTSTTTTASSATTRTLPSATAPTSISIPIPAKFAPQSFTAVDELTWWLLGPAPCTFAGETPPCGEILRTTDGGRSFVGIEAPRATLSTSTAGTIGYSQLRFADAKNGFAFGPSLYATHNGGVSWSAVDVGGAVRDLEISAGEAYAVVTAGASNAGRLMRSPVGRDDWTALSAAGEVSGGLWVLGREVIVQSGSGGGFGTTVLVSVNGGASFGRHPAPSPGLPCEFQAQSAPVIWAHCATGTESGVWYSSDFGANFVSGQRAGGAPPLPNSAVFAAASNTTAVVGYQQLYRTADSGATYTPVKITQSPAADSQVVAWAYLGFTNSTHGIGLGYVGSVAQANERPFYTTDAGQSYHLVPLP